MSISAVETKIPNAISVEVSGKALSVKLSDGRTVSISVDQYPRLAHATKQERANWRIIGRGHGIHWEDLDEDISVEGLLEGRRSGESRTSLTSWLLARHQPKFHPWKGEGYGKANDLGLPENLLILGESHYRDRDWEKEWNGQPTIGVVGEFKQQERDGYRLFTKSMRTILGPRARTDMWEDAAAPFLVTLESLRPTHIVACGKRLWKGMQKYHNFLRPPSETLVGWFDPATFPKGWPPANILGCYHHSQGQSVVLAIYHPSRNQPRVWHPVVERFLKYPAG